MHAAGPGAWPTNSPAVLPSAIPDHELICLIGRGAYGEVWMARNAIGTLRAVKIVHRQRFQRVEHFEREFKGLLKFEPISRSHEGLVDILQIGRRDDAGYFFYVMELADAARLSATETCTEPVSQTSLDTYMPHTLRSELHQRGSLPSAECVTIGTKLASALEHLHSNGLVHRDIKPSNIIFVKGEPKLADIGLVTAIDDARSLVGTAGYIPPEGPGTPQADLYSLGKVLYEIAFGKDRQDFPQLPPDLQSHSDYTALLELNEVVLKACETDPRRRYASAGELVRDLALLQDGKSVVHTRSQAQRWKVLKRFTLAASAVVLLIAALIRLYASKQVYTPNPLAAKLYADGQWYYNQCTTEDHHRAFELLTEAVNLDPKFPEPYGELVAIYAWGDSPDATTDQERLQSARQIVAKLQAINPNLAQTHVALSFCHFLERDWHAAEEEIKQAVNVKPDLALGHFFYCFYLCLQGKTVEAAREGQLAHELELPDGRRVSAIAQAWSFMAERRFDLAIEQLQQVLKRDRNFSYGHWVLGDCYDAQSNYPLAIEAYRKSSLSAGEDPTSVAEVFDALLKAYESSGAEGYLRKSIELVLSNETRPKEKQVELSFKINVAGCYARLGEKEKALDELGEHFDEPNVWSQIKFVSLYDSLHEEKRFKELVRRAKLEP